MDLLDDEAVEGTSETEETSITDRYDRFLISQESRPAKRPRLDASQDSSLIDESPHDDYDLPSRNRNDSDEDAQDHYKSKYENLMHVPEYARPYEETFVTQVDQIDSSPSRIRGPRWRKKSPTSPPGCRVESVNYAQGAMPRVVPPSNEEFDDFDDEDPAVLQALLSSQGDVGQGQNQSFSRGLDSTSRPPRATQSFRQTTLFGHARPENDVPLSQSVHNWPLASRKEVLTHHKLDYEALTTWVFPTNLGKTRDYQFNIIQRALYHNLLVALPTGLGKTFIAATVMLNWFRWTKDARMVFVAPTKPLVAQQVDACFHIAGIPRSQTTMLVGNVQTAIRAEEWKTKRVFFMTPQTLINDLKSGICDPKRLVLLVVDEAHRAKGAYAYVEVVKFLRRFNSSFRVLALTATPGSTVEAVQEVIDGLDIGRIEIRTEESLDIREYVHTKDIEAVTFENSEEIAMSLELFANALRPLMGKLASQNAYWSRDPLSITLFGLKQSSDNWMKSAGRNADQGTKGMVRAIFSVLMKLALPIELLKYHGIGPFYHKLKVFEDEAFAGKSKYAQQIVTNEHFKKLMNRMKAWVNDPDFEGHPKMSHLKRIILNHFMDAQQGRRRPGGEVQHETRIMVFSHYRDSAEEIARVLKRHEPMIKPHVFVGQAASKNSEGMDQKRQQQVVDEFKKGVFNVLIATSIGEEGLDIGEIDLIVCYDSHGSPIRMLQRFGRTGRKRAGNVVLLLMKGKEEDNFEKAKDNYVQMQRKIASGKEFRYHDDRSSRIVPKEIKPLVNKCIVEIPIENTQAELPEPRKRGAKNAKKPPKRFNMPDGIETGFMFLGEGRKSGKPESKKQTSESLLNKDIAIMLPLSSVLLSPDEELDLERRYAQVNGPEPVQIVHPPRIDAFPEQLRRLGRTAKVKHSRATRNLVAAHEAMQDPDRDWKRPISSEAVDSKDFHKFGAENNLLPKARQRKKERRRAPASQSSGTLLPLDDYDGNDSFIDDGAIDEDPFKIDSDDDLIEVTKPRATVPQEVEEPFYVSQKSIQDDGDLNELLPDFSVLYGAGGTPTSTHTRRKPRRAISDDEDEDE